jgi:hypothetical protein
MQLKLVAVSGAVGKQVFSSSQPVVLKGAFLTPSGANATLKIRDGGSSAASGEIVFFGRAPSAQGTKDFEFKDAMRFDKGCHVTVIGANAQAYLQIE